MRKKYYPRSYREKGIIHTDESGRECLSTIGRESLSNAWHVYHSNDEVEEYTHRYEIKSFFGETAHDTVQKIIDTIDFSFGDRNISPELLDILDYNKLIEEYGEQQLD